MAYDDEQAVERAAAKATTVSETNVAASTVLSSGSDGTNGTASGSSTASGDAISPMAVEGQPQAGKAHADCSAEELRERFDQRQAKRGKQDC